MSLIAYTGIIVLMPNDPNDFYVSLEHQISAIFHRFCAILNLNNGSDHFLRFNRFIHEIIEYIRGDGASFKSTAIYECTEKIYYMLPYRSEEVHDLYSDPFYFIYYIIENHETPPDFSLEQTIEEWLYSDASPKQQWHILSQILPKIQEYSPETPLLTFHTHISNLGESGHAFLGRARTFFHFELPETTQQCRQYLMERLKIDSWNANAIIFKIQNDLPLDNLDTTHPDLYKYRQILEDAAKKSNNRAAKAVLQLLENRFKVKMRDDDIFL